MVELTVATSALNLVYLQDDQNSVLDELAPLGRALPILQQHLGCMPIYSITIPSLSAHLKVNTHTARLNTYHTAILIKVCFEVGLHHS